MLCPWECTAQYDMLSPPDDAPQMWFDASLLPRHPGKGRGREGRAGAQGPAGAGELTPHCCFPPPMSYT